MTQEQLLLINIQLNLHIQHLAFQQILYDMRTSVSSQHLYQQLRQSESGASELAEVSRASTSRAGSAVRKFLLMSTLRQRSCCKHKKYTRSLELGYRTKKSSLRLTVEPLFLGKEWGGRQIKDKQALPQHYSSSKLSYSSHGINRGLSVRTVKRVHLERLTSHQQLGQLSLILIRGNRSRSTLIVFP